MSSPPLTTREFAYLYITGNGSHQEITEILGIEPSMAWNVGDTNERNGKTQRSLHWKKNTGLDDKESLESHLDAIFFLLSKKHNEIQELFFKGYDPHIQCVGYYPDSGHGVHLNRDIIRKAGQLNLAIDLDFYQVSANGHDC